MPSEFSLRARKEGRKEGRREERKEGGRKGKKEGRKEGRKEGIVAKALDGQRYPLPLCECMWV